MPDASPQPTSPRGGRWAPDPAFWRDRPVAVTGATGFLGGHLVDELLEVGARVACLVRDDVPGSPLTGRWAGRVAVVRGAVEDQAVVERLLGEHEAVTVVHLAAQTQVRVANRNPVSTYEANIAGTWALLEAARRSPAVAQVLVASSDKAYGAQPDLPYREDMPLLAINPYDVSKACADQLARGVAATYGLPVVVTRCGNFYGPGDLSFDRVVPGTIRSVLRGERPVVRSDGTLTRDYLYVRDGALAYLRLAEAMAVDASLAGEAFNLAGGRPVSVLELVALVQAACGTDLEPEVLGHAPNEIAHQWLAADKARERLGWAPAWSLEEGLAATVPWYAEHLRLEHHRLEPR